mmetsp:Transcript_31117/g.54078  ORF Transcript_31117/g.54078 Transcript_31117/m.54078 type:complete len:469 (-) Transcript_31117:4196-5602(-)
MGIIKVSMELSFYRDFEIRHRWHGKHAQILTVKFNNPPNISQTMGLIKAFPIEEAAKARKEFEAMKRASEITTAACKPYALYEEGGCMNLVMEDVEGIRLIDYEEGLGPGSLNPKILEFCLSLVDTLMSLNNAGLFYRNTSADHVIITRNDEVKLISFGHCTNDRKYAALEVKSLGLMVLKLMVGREELSTEREIDECLEQVHRNSSMDPNLHDFLSIACKKTNQSNFKILHGMLHGATISADIELKQSGELSSLALNPARYSSQPSRASKNSSVHGKAYSIKSEGNPVTIPVEHYKVPVEDKECTICKRQIYSIDIVNLSCLHYFHRDCLRTYINNVVAAAELFSQIVCPMKCINGKVAIQGTGPETIPVPLMLGLGLEADTMNKLLMLQDLGYSAQCPKCDTIAQRPMFDSNFRAYRVYCPNESCRHTYCSYCNEKNFHFFGKCKKLKQLMKSRGYLKSKHRGRGT